MMNLFMQSICNVFATRDLNVNKTDVFFALTDIQTISWPFLDVLIHGGMYVPAFTMIEK